MAAKKSLQAKSNRKRKTRKTILCVLIGIAVVIAILALLPEPKDTAAINESAWARQRIGHARTQLNKVTGLNVTSSWNNTCSYNSEGLTSNSLNCDTDLLGSFNITSKDQAMMAEQNIANLLTNDNVFGSVPLTGNYEQGGVTVPSEGSLRCGWGFNPPLRLVVDSTSPTQISFGIECLVKTTTAVYRITNGG